MKKAHRVIEFNQEVCLKEYFDINIELKKEANNDFEKYFLKKMNNAVLGKTMEKHKEARRY